MSEADQIQVLSLGAGVQSSTMALMAAAGEITPMPVAAIFADTQSEPDEVYAWLAFLESKLPFPVQRVTAGSLEKDILDSIDDPLRHRVGQCPFYVIERPGKAPVMLWASLSADDVTVALEGRLWRQCTKEYKLEPIRKESRRLMEQHDASQVIQWIGISIDEIYRVKPSAVQYMVNRHPLIDLRMDRNNCLRWLDRNGFPEPPKSACWFCPFTDPIRWREMKLHRPATFAKAVAFDHRIRNGLPGVRGQCFLHRSCVPLDEVDFSTEEDRGQLTLFKDAPPSQARVSDFNNECEGVCGV